MNVIIALLVVTRSTCFRNVTVTRTGVVNRETVDDMEQSKTVYTVFIRL